MTATLNFETVCKALPPISALQLRPQVAAFLDASSLWPHEAAADLADEWLGTFVQADSRWSKLHTGR